MNENLRQFKNNIMELRLPRWEEIPDLGLYCDQVLSIVEDALGFADISYNTRIITKSMINNYVKLEMIPRPIKRKYYQEHLAYLIVITILKQILSITEVRMGIEIQTARMSNREAYNLFCDELENSLRLVFGRLEEKEPSCIELEDITSVNMGVKLATFSFASQLLAKKKIEYNELLPYGKEE